MTRCINQLHEFIWRCTLCGMFEEVPGGPCQWCGCDSMYHAGQRECGQTCPLVEMYQLADGRRLISGAPERSAAS